MATLDSVLPDISEKDFFSKYIAQRKPVVISGLLDDSSFTARRWTSEELSYLADKAGDTSVLVEPMHPATQQFGTDVQRISMPFREFLQSLGREGPYHYLTTQYSGEEWDELTLFSPPTNALRDEFPEVPRLMGKLFLQQVNLWLGKSKDGSSSGLHHDFHDNLYCLLKGRKRFVLFPPKEHVNLYPFGTVHTVHENGVIAYDKMLRADGLDYRVALRTRVALLKGQLDALDSTKSKGKGKGRAATKERKALEKEYVTLREELEELAEDEQYGFPLEDDEDDVERLDDGSDLGSLAGSLTGEDDYDALMGDDGVDVESASADGEGQSGGGAEDEEKKEDPPSFSRIPTAFLHNRLDLPTTSVAPADLTPADFPNLAKAAPPYVVELSAGQMLYLPASWWHEVTSSSDGEADVHMALNWWFYPPNTDNFDEPYEDKGVWEYLRQNARKTSKEARLDTSSTVSEAKEGKRKRDGGEELSAKKTKI